MYSWHEEEEDITQYDTYNQAEGVFIWGIICMQIVALYQNAYASTQIKD